MSETIGQQFLRQTRYEYLEESPQRRGLPQPPLELPYDPAAPLLDLPEPGELHLPAADLRAIIEQRASLRSYSPAPLTPAELSYLLWCTQGVKRVTNRPVTLRTVPSAGARHAFETFLLINRVEGLTPGLYRFIALEHSLMRIADAPGLADQFVAACGNQEMVGEAAVTFFWAAVLERMTWRYVQRGYRYLFLDAGHVCQNLYLAAESINGGVCAIAAFDDVKLNHLLGLDGEAMFVVYLAAMGKRAG